VMSQAVVAEGYGPEPGAQLASVFAALACELQFAADLDQVLETVLKFAGLAVPCDRITIRLLPTKRRTGIVATSPAVPVGADAGLKPASHALSLHAVELLAARTSLGMIAFSAAHGRGFSTAETAAAQLVAIHTGLAIGTARSAMNVADMIDTRTVVAQAQGVVMACDAVDELQAFELLRRYSQDNNRKLRDVARAVVASRRPPGRK